MDPNLLAALPAVLAAIAASVEAGAGEAAKDLVKDSLSAARDQLLKLMRGKLKDDKVGELKLDVYALEPKPENAAALSPHLSDAGIAEDEEIVSVAREILAAAGPQAFGPGSVAVNSFHQENRENSTGTVGGVHNHFRI